MLRAIGRYLGRHHVALLALFVALGGTAVAATYINGKSIKPGSIPENRLTPQAVRVFKASDPAVYCAAARRKPWSYSTAPCRRRAEPIAGDSSGLGISIAVGADGMPVVAHGGHPVGLARCNDAACAGNNELDSGVNGTYFSGYADVAVSLDGNPVLTARYGGDNPGAIIVAPCNDAACAGNDESSNPIDGGGHDVGFHPSIAIGEDGNPAIGFDDSTDGNLKVARCANLDCSSIQVSTVDASPADVGEHTSIAIGANGNPVVAYYDATNGNLKVARCNDFACSGGNETISVVDSVGDVGQYASLAIGSSGNPLIAYYDATNGNLKVARCNDRACAGGDELRSRVAIAGDVGAHASLAIGLDGLPVIAYYDATNADLKLARCNDQACAGENESIATVDSTGDVGQGASLAIGVDGVPIVAYWDATKSALKVGRPPVLP